MPVKKKLVKTFNKKSNIKLNRPILKTTTNSNKPQIDVKTDTFSGPQMTQKQNVETSITETPKMSEPEEAMTTTPIEPTLEVTPEVPVISDIKVNDDQTLLSESVEFSSLDKKNKTIFLFGGILTITIIFVSIMIYTYSQTQISLTDKSKKTEITPQFTPSVTPKPNFQRADITFEVLNGSGIKGAAKKASEKLERLGYRVVKTGNTIKNYSKNQVMISSDLDNFSVLVLADLQSEFGVATSSGVPDETTASAQLIIGEN